MLYGSQISTIYMYMSIEKWILKLPLDRKEIAGANIVVKVC
jgi:hypothetical protein